MLLPSLVGLGLAGCDGDDPGTREPPAGVCGDFTVDSTLGEECDDGNLDSEDGCSGSCLAEFCGDGEAQAGLGESCDDGNTVSLDGCSGLCLSEGCGDGMRQVGEECDDGNPSSDDGCSSACLFEYCSDGLTQAGIGEDCDDGNFDSFDGCSSECALEYCGDGVLHLALGEQCDVGDPVALDGCDELCQLEFAFQVTSIDVNCDLIMGGAAPLPVELSVALVSSGSAPTYTFMIVVETGLSVELGTTALILASEATLDELEVDVSISGLETDSESFTLTRTSAAVVQELDADNDRIADAPVMIGTDPEQIDVVHDGASDIVITVERLQFVLSGFGSIRISSPAEPGAIVDCGLPVAATFTLPNPAAP